MKTVLLVGDNLGFAFWLGQALDRAGYETWPARSVPRRISTRVPLAVDLLVINASLPRAPAFAARLCRNKADFSIAVYEEATDLGESFPEASAVHQKPQTIDIAAKLNGFNSSELSCDEN